MTKTGRRITGWFIAAGIGVLLSVVVNAAILCENALRILPAQRRAPDAALATSIAAESGASWESVEIAASDGVALRGWWFAPAKPDATGVIAMHGVADTRSGMSAHIRMLLRHDFAVLAPDSRGHGVSGGDTITYGLREADDVRRWVDWMCARQQIRGVYGVGQSMGGAILLQSLRVEPRFRAAVADCPFATFEEISYDRLLLYAGLPRPAAWFLVAPAFAYARTAHGLDLGRISPVDAVRSTHVPVLLIHGTADTNVPPRHSRILHAGNPATELWEVPGARHVASISTQPQLYERKVVDWFRKHR
jgi:dipeptidyl aminopeptidase/acylaminoacyl peptidase